MGDEIGRELSMRMVMFHQAVADRFGLTATENKCLDLLVREGAMTAGKLAELTGLSTGAITKIVDRLEKAGFVTRERSRDDRRQVILQPAPDKVKAIGQIFVSLSEAMTAVALRYNAEQRAVVHDYLQRITDVLIQETLKLKDREPEP